MCVESMVIIVMHVVAQCGRLCRFLVRLCSSITNQKIPIVFDIQYDYVVVYESKNWSLNYVTFSRPRSQEVEEWPQYHNPNDCYSSPLVGKGNKFF